MWLIQIIPSSNTSFFTITHPRILRIPAFSLVGFQGQLEYLWAKVSVWCYPSFRLNMGSQNGGLGWIIRERKELLSRNLLIFTQLLFYCQTAGWKEYSNMEAVVDSMAVSLIFANDFQFLNGTQQIQSYWLYNTNKVVFGKLTRLLDSL